VALQALIAELHSLEQCIEALELAICESTRQPSLGNDSGRRSDHCHGYSRYDR